MPSRTISLTASALLGLLALPVAPLLGQGGKASKAVNFDTADHVVLQGTYWPSSKGKDGPVALLLHKTGAKSTEEGWKDLAEDLQKAGFAVLSFDFRGHGGSVNVKAKFWDEPHNRMNVRRRPGPTPPAAITFNDFTGKYFPYLINDIAAAKRFLEMRYNDPGECNLSNLVVIGAEDGATLGALWMASEAKRYRMIQRGTRNDLPESKDAIACVWLSISQSIGLPGFGKNISVASSLPAWLRDAGNRPESKVPMFFVYGKEDMAANQLAERLTKTVNPRYVRGAKLVETDELRKTGDFGVGTKLAGNKLLSSQFPTRDAIVSKYLMGFVIDEKRGLNAWENRKPDEKVFIWDFGPQKLACNPDRLAFGGLGTGLLLNVVPLMPLGIR